jgi:PAS domain S-box-containing protein
MPETVPVEVHDDDRLYRLLVESVRDYAIFRLDVDGRIMTWNAGAQRIKGYAAEEAIGRHFSMFYPEEDRHAGKPEWELVEAAAHGRIEDEGWRVRSDGSRFWANVVITALYDEGELIGFAKVTRDLTERMRSEARSRDDARRVAEAEAANRAKSEFLTTLSHELRTPLNAIAGYADLVMLGLRGPLTEEQRHDLERIRQSQRHLLGIIEDLLSYSRAEAGTLTYDIGRVVVADVVEEVVALLIPEADRHGVTLVHEGMKRGGAAVLADAAKLRQIVLNLVSNAVKHSPSGSAIRIKCEVRSGSAAIHVSDSGAGIAPDHQEAIFEPFVQLGRTLTSTHEGIGLGLAISRDLARAMGGDVTVESSEGSGATFTVWLPSTD